METKYYYFTTQGSRENNEDSVYVVDEGATSLAIVADGLGGHNDGEVASKLAVETISSALACRNPDEEEIKTAIENANEAVMNASGEDAKSMTTVAVAWIGNDKAIFANVGDSRIYLLRDGRILYQSTDHSAAMLAVKMGEIEISEIRNHPDKNRLLRALGNSNELKIDIKDIDLQRGDRMLLCSDGFWEYVLEEKLEELSIKSVNLEEWFDLLKQEYESNKEDNCDNCTAVVMEVQ